MLLYICLLIASLFGSNLHHEEPPLKKSRYLNEDKISFADMPDEIKSHIFSYVDRKDVSLVSHNIASLRNKSVKEIQISKMQCVQGISKEDIKKTLDKLTRLQSIDFSNSEYDKDSFNKLISQISHYGNIAELSFVNRSWVTDNILCNIPEHITSLNLSWCRQITDAGLKKLPSHLTHLNLSSCHKITGAGLASLKGLSANLTHLNLGNCNITDADLNKLPAGLTHLNLGNCNITDADLNKLPAGLTHLDLEHCKYITDESIKQLPAYLMHMKLSSLCITDACLEHLYRLKDLQFINLTGSVVTEEGRQELSNKLPNITIKYPKSTIRAKEKQILNDHRI